MLCPACFSESYDLALGVCQSCGYESKSNHIGIALPLGTLLKNGEYQIGKLLGKPGGFGLTYLGFNIQLETKVAIKEYLPLQIAGRGSGSSSVSVHTVDNTDVFEYGLKSFLDEARTLAQLRHDNIVRVHSFFQENNTAYMVMEYLEGQNLAEYLAKVGKVTAPDAVALFLPILEALDYIHQKNILHRDIKPANIYLTEEGKAILLDFGSARQAVQEKSQTLTAILTPGFAPWEQYHRKGKQGPWTDVYACAATMYFMVTGVLPPDGAERAIEDNIEPIGTLIKDFDASISQAITRGLAVRIEDRTANAVEFKQNLLLDSRKYVVQRKQNERQTEQTSPGGQKPVTKLWRVFFQFVLIAIVAALVGLGAIETIITPRQFTCEEALSYNGGLDRIKKAAEDRITENEQKIQRFNERQSFLSARSPAGIEPNQTQLDTLVGLFGVERMMIESDKHILSLSEQEYCSDSFRAKVAISIANSRDETIVQVRKHESRSNVLAISLVLSFGITWLINRRR